MTWLFVVILIIDSRSDYSSYLLMFPGTRFTILDLLKKPKVYIALLIHLRWTDLLHSVQHRSANEAIIELQVNANGESRLKEMSCETCSLKKLFNDPHNIVPSSELFSVAEPLVATTVMLFFGMLITLAMLQWDSFNLLCVISE